jgi:hypothetical protein
MAHIVPPTQRYVHEVPACAEDWIPAPFGGLMNTCGMRRTRTVSTTTRARLITGPVGMAPVTSAQATGRLTNRAITLKRVRWARFSRQ